jgi:hypothetical protein
MPPKNRINTSITAHYLDNKIEVAGQSVEEAISLLLETVKRLQAEHSAPADKN